MAGGAGNRTLAIRQNWTFSRVGGFELIQDPRGKRSAIAPVYLCLIENGIEAEERKLQEFFDLAERFRNERDPEETKRLGDQLGRMVFGG